MARKERYLVGLDVGTSKITAIVGETTDEGSLDIIGIGLADSRGIRRGVVVNLEAAVESIKKAIDEYGPHYANFDLPIIDGLVQAPRNGKPSIDRARAQLAARVIDSVAPNATLASRLSQIDVGDVHNAMVLLDDDPAWLYLGEEQFRERLQSYVEVAAALREQVAAEIDYVDLRYGERVYVKQRNGTPAAPARAGRGRRTG